MPCSVALRGVTYRIEAEAKGKYISPTSPVFCAAKYIGVEYPQGKGGVNSTITTSKYTILSLKIIYNYFYK